jgi:hypothetical protein
VSKILITLIVNICLNEKNVEKQNECVIYYNNCVISETFKDVEEDKAFKMCKVKWNNENNK